MSKKITLENVDSSELPEIPVIGEVKQIRFTQDMELVSTLADSDLFMIQAGADLEARPNTITFDLIIKNLSGPIEEGSKKFVTGDMMFKVIGDMNLLDTWDNTNIVSSLNATYVNVRRIEEELRREINRSTEKDDLHDTQIANLRQDLTSTNEMLNQEINRSVAKDKEHDELLAGLRDDVDSTSEKLDAEIDRSTAKDAEHDNLLKGLRVDVNANKSAIDSEVARSTARDEAHDAAIAKNASDITTEVNRAKAEEAKIRQEMQAADTNLQNAITAETERATGVEEDLQRQITDLSGSTDDRLEALEALSHEQNTDTGTTSKTFVIDSGNTGAMLKAEGGGLSTRTKGDAGYANFTVQNLVIKGDVTQEGDTFITQAERVEVRDNMILINEGETGAGVTAGFAGIEVDRGTEQNFMFGFNESDGMFKIGKEGNMFDVALRQPVGDMIDGMFASWDAATKTFKTTNVIPYNRSLDFKFDPEIADATLKMKLMEAGLALFMSGDDSILALLPGMPQDEVKYSLISTNTNGVILGDSSGSNDKFILDIRKPSFISPALDKNVIMGGKNAYFSYYSHRMGSLKTIIASCGVKAPSFYRVSDNAEVLYSIDQARLTDGMFLSWDATNKMVVANNLVPEGIKLYFGTSSNYIDYYNEDNGYIRFITNTGTLRFSTSNNFTTFRSSSNNGFQFVGKIESTYGVLNSSSDNFTIGTKQGSGSIKLYIGESSYITTPFSAVTFKRSSDNSEVLYQADLKSVLTGKETNYAPTVKAVSDAIDAVNTGTAESLKNYLKLSGGNMTGIITMNNGLGIFAKNTNGVDKRLISKSNTNSVYVGDTDGAILIHTNSSHVSHFRDGVDYMMYDSYNLPDPATKSGNNAFTGTNSFVGGKFSVVGSECDVYVSAVGNLVSRSTYANGGWLRSLEFSDNNVVVARFGVKAITTDNVPITNFVGILVGKGTVNDSQYKFRTESLDLSTTFRINFGDESAISTNESTIIFGSNKRNSYIRSNDSDLFHTKSSTNYKIWDASNLPTPASTSDIPDVSDMARRSEANTFTAQNTFTAGQFNVGPFKVTATGSLLIDMTNTMAWERSIMWSNNSTPVSRIGFGVYGDIDTDRFAWIGLGDVQYDTAQYKFYDNSIIVPSTWSLEDKNRNALVWSPTSDLVNFGRSIGTTRIRSGNVDLIHTKGETDYKILDESNYSQYLPVTNKWTYGFVYENKTTYDLNTDLVGPDNGKLAYNYAGPSYWTNGPTGMSYGTVVQIWGSGLGANAPHLMPQLAFDVNHNVAGSTRYMWFRTANDLGYGDSSNWKRVLTADENVAALSMDENSYPTLMRIDRTTYNWLRTPAQGLLPNTQKTLDSGGTSYIGTKDWAFGYATIHTIYSKRYMFGDTGVDFRLDTNNKIAATISGSLRGIEIGDLLVSSNYADAVKVPTNGIFASGVIKSPSGFTSNYRLSNINIAKTGNDVWHLSSFANNPANIPGLDPASGQIINDGALLTYFWEGDYAFQLAGDIDGTGMAYRSYTPSTGVTKAWKFLADTGWVKTKLDSYLPLTGGTVSGLLTISRITPYGLILNNADTNGTDVIQVFRVNGVNKFLLGWSNPGGGAFIQRSDNDRCMVLMSDGLYTGVSLGNTVRVATLTDLGGYLPLTGGTLTRTLKINSRGSEPLIINNSTSAGEAYIVPQTQGTTRGAMGWNSSLGMFLEDSRGYTFSMKADGVYFGVSSSSLVKLLTSTDLSSYATQSWVTSQGYLKSHQTIYALTFAAGAFAAKTFTPTSSAVTVNVPTKTSHLTNDSGFLTSVPSTYATQSWVTSQGYLTSITKSMVTTALGYTPPTTNTTYSQATSSTLGLVKIGASSLGSKEYAVALNSSGQMYVSVPWTDTNTTYGAATTSTAGLMAPSQVTKLNHAVEYVDDTDHVHTIQVVDTIPAVASQTNGVLYLKFT